MQPLLTESQVRITEIRKIKGQRGEGWRKEKEGQTDEGQTYEDGRGGRESGKDGWRWNKKVLKCNVNLNIVLATACCISATCAISSTYS